MSIIIKYIYDHDSPFRSFLSQPQETVVIIDLVSFKIINWNSKYLNFKPVDCGKNSRYISI